MFRKHANFLDEFRKPAPTPIEHIPEQKVAEPVIKDKFTNEVILRDMPKKKRNQAEMLLHFVRDNEAKKRVPALTIKDVKNWLSKQDTYTFHKFARRHFIRNRVIVSAIDEQWQIDLVSLEHYKKTK